MHIKKGEIYLADLNPAIGSEQGGVRPVLIVQNNKGNKYSTTTIVAAISGRAFTKKSLPTHYYLPDSACLKTKSIVMLEQIRVIDQKRLIKYIGKVSPNFMKIINKKLLISLDLKCSTD